MSTPRERAVEWLRENRPSAANKTCTCAGAYVCIVCSTCGIVDGLLNDGAVMTDSVQLGRFVIRDLNLWDGLALFKLTGDPAVMKYMGFPVHKTVGEATQLIETYSASSTAKWQCVCDADNPADVLGVFGFEVKRHSVSVVIMFRRDWKARGAGREFSTPFVEWTFTHPRIRRVWAFCHVDNVPVQRVLERMGAVREGCMQRFEVFPNISDEPQDCYLYAITR